MGKIDREALQVATILHDIGYSLNKEDMRHHAEDGAVLAKEYLESIGYPAEHTVLSWMRGFRQRKKM